MTDFVVDARQADDGIQPLEALLFTLDQINNDSQLLPGLKLGVVAHDSCDNIVHALDECLDFVTGALAFYRPPFS